MNMKEHFEEMELELITFDAADILTTSGDDFGPTGGETGNTSGDE